MIVEMAIICSIRSICVPHFRVVRAWSIVILIILKILVIKIILVILVIPVLNPFSQSSIFPRN